MLGTIAIVDSKFNGDPRQPQGLFASFSGFFSPISKHVLCYDHAEAFEPLQPATTMSTKEMIQFSLRPCPFCDGGPLREVWLKSKKMRCKKRKFRYLRWSFSRHINNEIYLDCYIPRSAMRNQEKEAEIETLRRYRLEKIPAGFWRYTAED